jgi:cellulose synthase/poly-beta-1,6-N-acetylglucosamine synthase-like glycosyltransferase
MSVAFIFYLLNYFLLAVVGLTTLYLLFFSIASLFNRHTTIPHAKKQNRFLVLIPSYKKDKAILNTVSAILGQTYPQRLFDVTVISDHQSEMTNMRLAQYTVTLLTPNFEKSSKLKSLQYAMLKLLEFKIYDIVLILDADNIVEPEFLEHMNDAFEFSGTKAVQSHRLAKNRDTSSARLASIFEEINNSIFRRGHINIGLSSALLGSGVAYDFVWFKNHIMRARANGEDKELEAMLMREHIFVDYFDSIFIYDEKTREASDFNKVRGRWISTQLRSLLTNIRFLPSALLSRHYDWVDKIIQWMLLPRTIALTILIVMSILVPFFSMTMGIQWWGMAFLFGLALAIATPNDMVDEHWDKDFIMLPISTAWGVAKKIWNKVKSLKRVKKP